MAPPLQNRVALVAGATRGAGRAIAVELGAAGARVYCTGRSLRGRPSPLNRPETLEETAERVTAAGGEGIALAVDHSQPQQVEAALHTLWEREGRIDLLVNNIWGGERMVDWGKRFWESDLRQGLALLEQAVHTHIITSRLALPYLIRQNHGLVVEVTDGADWRYRGHFFYDLAKTGVMRLAVGLAAELADFPQISAVSITPGFLRSEEMLEHFGVTESTWQQAIEQDPYFAGSETPHYLGRAIVALATDPQHHRFSGQALSSWGLSEIFPFTDLDGSRPHWGNFFAERQGHQ